MNNLITIPLAVLSSLSFFFQIETTTLENNNSSIDETIDNTTTYVKDPIMVHNADVGIFPGSPDTGNKTFVPKSKISPIAMQDDLAVTGIKSAVDGKQILVYATYGNIILLPNHPSSSAHNRIEQSSNMTINYGEVFELTYNGSINKWVITDRY